MARDTRESRITADREMVQDWAGTHDAVPVRYAGTEGESGRLRIVPGERMGESHEELTWDEFYEELDRGDRVVLYHGEGTDEPFEVVHRDEAVGRASLEDEEIERRLLDGETITSEVTETTVVERTVIEEATIESEVVDGEITSDEIVDAELLTRDVVDCEVMDVGDVDTTGPYEAEQFEAGYRSDDRLEVQVEVDESWSLTREVLERLTVESRVVDTDAHEIDTVEGDRLQSTISIEGVQQSLLESGVLEGDVEEVENVDSRSIESHFREGNVIETRLVQRSTVDEEMALRREYSGEITEGETVTADTVHSETVESTLLDREELEAEGLDYDTVLGSVTTGAEADAAAGTTTATTDEMAAADETTTAEATTTSDVEMGESGTPSDIQPGAGETLRATPTADDKGKHVIDATGDDVGIVVDVSGDTMYVDPHPSITERIKAALGWGDLEGDDAYPIDDSRVSRVTGDHVELAVEEEIDEDERR